MNVSCAPLYLFMQKWHLHLLAEISSQHGNILNQILITFIGMTIPKTRYGWNLKNRLVGILIPKWILFFVLNSNSYFHSRIITHLSRLEFSLFKKQTPRFCMTMSTTSHYSYHPQTCCNKINILRPLYEFFICPM